MKNSIYYVTKSNKCNLLSLWGVWHHKPRTFTASWIEIFQIIHPGGLKGVERNFHYSHG